MVDFSSAEEAERNNDRAETREWASKLLQLIDGEPDDGNYDEVQGVG